MNNKLINKIIAFRDARDWKQFHSSENLAKSIAIEAAELLEEFQWNSKAKDLENLKKELADVLIYCFLLANNYGFNVEKIIEEKLKENDFKYPVKKVKGSSKKYTEYK
jgi:NTP pyrophosphatase (non-canonical NTP hydrolase)